MKKTIKTLVRCFTVAVLTACGGNNQSSKVEYKKDTQLGTVSGYLILRYINDYGYADYCVFKPNNCHKLIDTSMGESIIYQQEYYKEVVVSDIRYEKTEDITEAEYSMYEIENNPIISKAERGIGKYHWKMTPNEKGIADNVEVIDGEYSKNLILLEIESNWYVYIQVH